MAKRVKNLATTTAVQRPQVDTLLRQRLVALMRRDARSVNRIHIDTGIPQSTLCAINTGARADLRAAVVVKLARALGLSALELGELLYETHPE